MGKIRVKVLGDEQSEELEQQKTREKREQKKAAKAAEKGVASVGVSESEIAEQVDVKAEAPAQESTEEAPKKAKKEKFAQKATRHSSKRYKENASSVDKNKTYQLSDSIGMLKKLKATKFDETVELHINVKEKGVNGAVSLPHGTGKKRRIVIADEKVIAEIEKGKINFDVLVATPSMMPQLAKVAKVLGPRGLMPNPKSGTITQDPEGVVAKLSAGQVNFKTESAAPIIHMSVGKLSFEEKKIEENIKEAIKAVGLNKIINVTLKSTMSPGIKVDLTAIK